MQWYGESVTVQRNVPELPRGLAKESLGAVQSREELRAGMTFGIFGDVNVI